MFFEFLYRSEQFDAGLGVYYLRARYYRPKFGRFATADRIETTFAREQWNELPLQRYAYAGSDPVGRVDPSGDDEIEVAVIEKQSESTIDMFLKSLAAAGLTYCAVNNYDRENFSGRLQAQGKVFRDPGKGESVTWSQAIGPPAIQGLAMLTVLYLKVDDGKRDKLGRSFALAANWIGITCPLANGCWPQKKSFYNDKPVVKDANRVDVEINFGWAFKPFF